MRIGNGCLVEGIPERGGDGFVRPWQKGHQIDDCFDYGRRERGDRSSSPESCSKDVIDLLPSDPFGMDISTTFTAITGWLEDLEVDCGGYGLINTGNNRGEYDLYTGLNFIWNSAVQAFPSNFYMGGKSDFTSGAMHEAVGPLVEKQKGITKNASCGDDDGSPHEALFYALSSLGIRDLLSVERVCKSLHSTVQSDPLLWRSIHIAQPLNEKICDDVLLQLATRAQGNLQSLSLVDCPRITDDSLRDILETNPRLTKLCVPGCTRLSIEVVVNNLKAFNSKNTPGIKQLRIGGLYGIMDEHFEELKLLLGVDVGNQLNDRKPLFCLKRSLYLSSDDDRAIDIEACPKCQKLRLVYDCPSEGCRENRVASQACRACRLCIPRCYECGCCINDCEYEETFSLDLRCSDCSKRVKCPDGLDDGILEDGVPYELVFNSSVHG